MKITPTPLKIYKARTNKRPLMAVRIGVNEYKILSKVAKMTNKSMAVVADLMINYAYKNLEIIEEGEEDDDE